MSTLKVVAEKAGVSTITVSRVLNAPEKVKPETRIMVERVLKELNYSPNQIAKALVSNKTGIIDVYIPEHIALDNPFVMYFIAGISEALSTQMYSFLILRNRNREHNCDGYIVTGLLRDEFTDMWDYAKARERPMALFGHAEVSDIDSIDVDNTIGARDITDYLIQAGHKRIAMINVDEQKDFTHDRLNGFRQALDKNSLSLDAPIVKCQNSAMGGYNAVKELLNSYSPTSIFCATDTIAIGAIHAITEKGLSVPEDISIVGFDGLGHHLLTNPHITTVGQPIYKIGKMLAETLLDKVYDKEKNYTSILVKPSIIEGKSVCKPHD